MNSVEVDEASLIAEAHAAVQAATPEPAPVDAGQVVNAVQADSWAPAIAGVMPMLVIGVFPQWDITEAERTEFGEALTQCLDQVFPGGLNGKYACWVRLMVAGGGVCALRYLKDGKLPPIGPKGAKDAKADETKAA